VKSPAIIVDVDGCLAEFNDRFLELLNTTAARRGEVQHFDFGDGASVPQTWHWFELAGFSKATVREAWAFVTESPEWWHALPYYHDAPDFLDALARLRDQDRIAPYFVTSRPNHAVADWTYLWLKQLGYARPNVIVVNGTGKKAHVAQAVEAVAILDDHGPNFAGLPATCKAYLLDRPWNQDDEGPYTRITSLHQFLDAIRGPQELRSFAAA
jgi:FMN phosphatase YigB (HAD superfamily)